MEKRHLFVFLNFPDFVTDIRLNAAPACIRNDKEIRGHSLHFNALQWHAKNIRTYDNRRSQSHRRNHLSAHKNESAHYSLSLSLSLSYIRLGE